MKVLVTGAKGFIGTHLVLALKERGHEVVSFDKENSLTELESIAPSLDFVFHLAGVNRPENENDYQIYNADFTRDLLSILRKTNFQKGFLLSSSIQATNDTPYGKSKRLAEEQTKEFGLSLNCPVYIFRLSRVFGKWCRPFYNNVIATFAYQAAHHQEMKINCPNTAFEFNYIDDVVSSFIECLDGKRRPGLLFVEKEYKKTLEEIRDLLLEFANRDSLILPDTGDEFIRRLHATYTSYLEENDFAKPLISHVDHRGSFTEILKTYSNGQVSVNVIKPGIVKGNHYHNSKTEKYVVVSGHCLIRFRKVGTDKVITYEATDKEMKVIDIPAGYVHNIENIGDKDAAVLMWADELFNKDNDDTHAEMVEVER